MLGLDPEVFVVDADGKPVPAWRFYPAKANKIVVPEYGNYFRDGYALEFNFNPDSCRARIGNAFTRLMAHALTRLPAGHKFVTNAAVKIDLFDAMRDVPADAQVFGCDPAYNAYTGREFTVDLDAMSHEYRYAGGHLHISNVYTNTDEEKFQFIRLCDLFIGLPLAFLFDSDDEVRRRRYYGKAGECRLQRYPSGDQGIEYRTPSPRLFNRYMLASMFFGVLRTIAGNWKELYEGYNPKWEAAITTAINTCNVDPRMLQTANGYYTPELLISLKEKREFSEHIPYSLNHDNHTAFTEHVRGVYGTTPGLGYKMLGMVERGGYPELSGRFAIKNHFKVLG